MSAGEIQNPKSEIRNTGFDWRIYADATCAGLSVLIPLPLVDIVFETVFRHRIPGTISRARHIQVAPGTRRRLGRGLDSTLSLEGCFKLFFKAIRYLLRRIWRKIVYIFTIKDAVTALSEYWNRAYLIDHMVRAGHLGAGTDTDLAVQVFNQTLREADLSPLMGLARQTVANAHHVLQLLVRARRLARPRSPSLSGTYWPRTGRSRRLRWWALVRITTVAICSNSRPAPRPIGFPYRRP